MKVQPCPFTRLVGCLAIIIAAAMLASCSSTPKVDWSSRVGSYTYDQAVIDMGPPDKSTELSDGSKVAEWITSKSGPRTSIGFGVGSGSYGRGYGTSTGVGVSTPVGGSGANYLRLTFGPDGVLKEWSKPN